MNGLGQVHIVGCIHSLVLSARLVSITLKPLVLLLATT